MKLSEVNFYAYEQPFMHCLYFICERKFYARTQVSVEVDHSRLDVRIVLYFNPPSVSCTLF